MRTKAGKAVLVPVVMVLTGLAACSVGDDDAATDNGSTDDAATTDTATDDAATDDATTLATVVSTTGPGTELAPATEPTVTVAPTEPTEPPLTTNSLVEVPETGVPGLDSEDSFCAAWSRFGGSWQVIQVAANFAPDRSVVPAMEVVAAPVVTAAYDAMLAAWPAELADEREAVADGFFGPLARRSETALEALVAAGATADDLVAIGRAWEAALAARQPDDPVVTPELAEEQRAVVAAAAVDLDARLVGFVDDPSLRITVETPRTDTYLATACPDQGALTGAEVDGT